MFSIEFLIALVIAITVHEFAHAWVAYYLGDPTAKHMGRVTLNPVAHLDLFGTILLFLIGLGWGKPVPVNPHNLRHPKRDSTLVSLAGPASNILVAIAVSFPLKHLMTTFQFGFLLNLMSAIFSLNILLAIFNFIPLPPLDGSKIIGIFIPNRYYGAYEAFLRDGIKYFIAFILIDSFILSDVFGFSIFGEVIGRTMEWVSSLILFGA